MKIQHKTELLRSFSRSLSKLDNEKVNAAGLLTPLGSACPTWHNR